MDRGSLYKVLKSGLFDIETARRIIREVLLGLDFLHQHGIIHRYYICKSRITRSDIKADNILIDKNNNIKIADFGISVLSTSQSSDHLQGEFGTSPSSPPPQALPTGWPPKSSRCRRPQPNRTFGASAASRSSSSPASLPTSTSPPCPRSTTSARTPRSPSTIRSTCSRPNASNSSANASRKTQIGAYPALNSSSCRGLRPRRTSRRTKS